MKSKSRNGYLPNQGTEHLANGASGDVNGEYEGLLDSNEAAELLRIHPKTLQRLARNGEIPAVQIGKLWRFRLSALNAWVTENSTPKSEAKN